MCPNASQPVHGLNPFKDTGGHWVPVGNKQVPWVHFNVGGSLVLAAVDGQLGWRIPRQSYSLPI
jgi:hypothetical protein